ncbi:PEP-CTERM sorting domain-containing protein [uncultured Sphingomonas sp.]
MTPVPAPPMVLLFGAAAAALVARQRFAKRPAAA